MALMVLAYVASGRVGLTLAVANHNISTVWPATGIAVTGLLFLGLEAWPAVAVAAVAVNLLNGAPVVTSLLIAPGNTLAPVLAVWLMRRFELRTDLERIRDAVVLVLAGLAAMTLSATGGIAALILTMQANPVDWAPAWFVWWVGDAMGVLLVAPALLVSLSRRRRLPSLRAVLEIAAICALAAAVELVRLPAFVPLGVVFPLVVALTLRRGQAGAATSVLVIAASNVAAAIRHAGAFTGLSLNDELIQLQIFNGALALTALVLGAAVEERGAAARALAAGAAAMEERVQERTRELRDAQRAARIGSWRWQSWPEALIWDETLDEILGTTDRRGAKHSTADFLALVHPEDRERVQGFIRRPLEAGEKTQLDYRVLRADGEVRWLNTQVQCAMVAGRAARFGTSQDVTERIEAASGLERAMQFALEQQRKALEAAEGASLAKSEQLSRMSHELRTPLASILGYADLVLLDTPPAQREAIQAIIAAASHLRDLVDEILDISRIESGRSMLSTSPVSLSDVIEESMGLVMPRAAERSITMHKELPPKDRLLVMGNSQRLRQVLLNLLTNAIDYNLDAGRVTVRALVSGDTVRCEVQDTGIGIPREKAHLVWEPFERLEAFRAGIPGTGLGLALTRRIIEALGGSVGVESESGWGSTFWFELLHAEPTDGEAAKEPPREPALVAEVQARRVLLVEDNPTMVAFMQGVCRLRPSVQLLVAERGRQALDMARSESPDLILLDLHLPDINGDQVMVELKSDERLRSIPVVVLTADASADQSERLLSLGASAYLTKPARVQELLQVLDGGGDRRRPQSAYVSR
jgi:PAS domain S-box-containing protein